MKSKAEEHRKEVETMINTVKATEVPTNVVLRTINRLHTLMIIFLALFTFLGYVVLDFISFFATGKGLTNLYYYIWIFYKSMLVCLWKGN